MKRIIKFALLALLSGCSSETGMIHSLPDDDRITKSGWRNDRYSHVSDSAPEALKPFYDEELTRDLNR
jgi:hypothetical protein